MRLRWSVVRALLEPTRGREQAGIRPILIVSNEPFNRNSGLITAIPLTSARRAAQPWEVLVPARVSGLEADSIALPQHIRTISAERLRQPTYGRITDRALRQLIASRILEHLSFQDLARLAWEE